MTPFACPRCRGVLEERVVPGRVLLRWCPRDHGVFVTKAELAHALPFAAAARLEEARERATPGEAPCAACGAAMQVMLAERHGDVVELDACPACEGHWFDGDELERVRRAPPPSATDRTRATPEGVKGLHGGTVTGGVAEAGVFVAFESILGLLDGW